MQANKLWRPNDQDFINNPFPIYEQLLDLGPVFKSPSGDFVFLSYSTVKNGLKDPNFRVDVRSEWIERLVEYTQRKGRDFTPLRQLMNSMLIQLNPPDHSLFRSLVTEGWPKKEQIAISALNFASKIVESLPKEGDFVELVARRMSLLMINDTLKIGGFDTPEMISDGVHIQGILNPYLTLKELESINQSSVRSYERFKALYEANNADCGSLVSKLKTAQSSDAKNRLDPVSLIQFLWIAGLENSTTLISTCIYLLLKNKSLIDQLESDLMIQNFIQEVLRLHSPVQLVGRSVIEEIEIHDFKIPANQVVTLCIGSANRDPSVFENPNTLDLERKNRNHIAFGHGIHHCLGNQLALIEAFYIIKMLAPKLYSLTLTNEPIYRNQLTIRSINQLTFETK